MAWQLHLNMRPKPKIIPAKCVTAAEKQAFEAWLAGFGIKR